MSGIKAQKWRFALKHAILLLYILLSCNSCASLSLMTDIKRQNKDLNSVREELKNVNMNIMRQLINQETLIRVSISKTFNDMMNDFATMKKSLTETQTELRVIKEENYRLKEQVSQHKTQLAEYNTTLQQTRKRQDTLITEVNTNTEKLKAMGAENKVLKERSSEYMKHISNLTVTLEQIQKGHTKLLTDSNNLTREFKELSDENKILKNQSLEYEREIAEMNFSFEQIHEKQVVLTKKSNIHEKEINDISKNKIILQKQNLKTEEKVMNLSKTVQQLQQDQITLKSETTSHSGKIKDINDSSNALEERISEHEKALANYINFTIAGKFFKDCAEINTQNILKRIYEDGVYTIHPSKKIGAVKVYCDMTTDGGGWTVIQRRFDGSTEFFRNWTDYKHGFGDAQKEYWLGNDIIHVLTANAKQELRIDLQKFSGAKAYAKYSQFAIGDENAQYRLSVSGYTGTAGDGFVNHNGMYFSTKDRDNDINSANCATRYTGAWWYWGCHSSNLNGHYFTSDGRHSGKGVDWYKFGNAGNSMKSTKMMIRSKLSKS